MTTRPCYIVRTDVALRSAPGDLQSRLLTDVNDRLQIVIYNCLFFMRKLHWRWLDHPIVLGTCCTIFWLFETYLKFIAYERYYSIGLRAGQLALASGSRDQSTAQGFMVASHRNGVPSDWVILSKGTLLEDLGEPTPALQETITQLDSCCAGSVADQAGQDSYWGHTTPVRKLRHDSKRLAEAAPFL